MEQLHKEMRRALILCLPYLSVVFFRDDLDRYFFELHSRVGNPLMVIYMFICSVLILVFLLQLLASVKLHFKEYGWKVAAPIFIYCMGLLNSFWSPVAMSSEAFKSPVEHRAQKKDHYGFAKINMRKNGRLEIRYPGPFGLSEWEYGLWRNYQHTYYFAFENSKDALASDEALSDTLTDLSGILVPLHMPADTAMVYSRYLFKLQGEVEKR